MNKSKIILALNILKKTLDGLIVKCEKTDMKGEKAVVRTEKGQIRIYAKRKSDPNVRYLPKSNAQEIKVLAQRRYDIKLLEVAKAEKLQIERCLKVLEPEADIETVFDFMPEALKPYIVANEKTDLGYAQMWQNKRVDQARRLKEGEGFSTMRGDVVRSKSEVIIADRLFKAGIPYRYEVLLPMEYEDISYVYPDFQILNTRTKEVFFWEHLGMMDDPKYANGQIKKISGYARSGYILGKSLILTFESKERPLDTFCVDGLIETFLL